MRPWESAFEEWMKLYHPDIWYQKEHDSKIEGMYHVHRQAFKAGWDARKRYQLKLRYED